MTPSPPSLSAASVIRRRVTSGKRGRFWRCSDFGELPKRAVETELARLTETGELARLRKGLYWRGATTRFGMLRPQLLDVALEVAGPGSGPAGLTAAHRLGLTTQVPATIEVAVAGRTPKAWPGVRFTQRSVERRVYLLTPTEVAVLELLREPEAAEADWSEIVGWVRRMAVTSAIRPGVLAREVPAESSVKLRQRWEELELV